MADPAEFRDGFGARVRIAVQRAETSVRGLQRRLKAMGAPGSSYGNISKVMAGISTPNVQLVDMMAEALGVSPERAGHMIYDCLYRIRKRIQKNFRDFSHFSDCMDRYKTDRQ